MPTLTNDEIERIEIELGHKLPGLYHKLLLLEGYGPIGPTGEIYHPLKVRSLYEPFFDDTSQLFNPYFPFGCNNAEQEIWVIDASAERAAAIWHETVPEDWPDEKWLPYEEWGELYLNPFK